MKGKPEEGGRVAVRATIGLSGLPAGTEALVDPASPYIANCLAQGWLVPIHQEPAE